MTQKMTGGEFNEGTIDIGVCRVKGTKKDGKASVESLKGQRERESYLVRVLAREDRLPVGSGGTGSGPGHFSKFTAVQ